MLCSYSNKHLSSKTRKKKNSGAALVEAALVFPVLILLVFGMCDMGLALNNYLSLNHVAREAARLAAVKADGYSMTNADIADIANKVFNATEAQNVKILSEVPSAPVSGDEIHLTLQYPHTMIFLKPLSGTYTATVVMRKE